MVMKNEDVLFCQEHTDIAIDDYILDSGTFPVLEKISSNTSNACCKYCKSNAIYIIKVQKEKD